jgi:hypothetical protein
MASQNILHYYGSNLDIKVDYSELYDHQLSKTQGDYNKDVLDLTKPITYSTLVIDTTMEDFACVKSTIYLTEYDNSGNDSSYIYSGLTFNLHYYEFTQYFLNVGIIPYPNTILNNDIYTFTGITGETHYLKISGYNRMPSIDYRLPQFSENDIITGLTPTIIPCITGINEKILPTLYNEYGEIPQSKYFKGNSEYPVSDWYYGKDAYEEYRYWVPSGVTPVDSENENYDILYQGTCCPISPSNLVKPWAYKFDTGGGNDNCSPILQRRTEKGWTLDFVFNRETLSWSNGSVFYYFGVRGEDDITKYADNNLSFRFTSDGRIRWDVVRYSGTCDSVNGYTESFYLDSGVTPRLCTIDNTKDFNVTITFERYKYLTECNVDNDGGWNDMIDGKTVTNNIQDILKGTEEKYELIEKLNKKWISEVDDRKGLLRVYLNGNPIYKKENWIEVVPSTRGYQPFIQSWGGGPGLMDNIHNGTCCFNIKKIQFYEEPLDFVHVHHNYLLSIKPYFDIFECGLNCAEDLYGYFDNGLLLGDNGNIITQDNNIILY